jgi:tRNA (guanosine-2'-O-)-methyltransferase
MDESLIQHLETFVTPRRLNLFDEVLEERTRYITIALEDIYQSQNASAVLRTCDNLGIQDVHIIENRNDYTVNPDVSLGSEKWLTIKKYRKSGNNTIRAITVLREQGYRIVATSPHKTDTELTDFEIEKGKIALFFGTELQGLTEDVMKNADEFLKIPMHGFTESYNISVSAAIICFQLSEKLKSSDLNWRLTKSEKQEVKLDWLRASVKRSKIIEKEFLHKLSQNQNIAK